jgi:hypothetical protein
VQLFFKSNNKKGEKFMKNKAQYLYIIPFLFLAAGLAGSGFIGSGRDSFKAGSNYTDIPSPPPQSLDALYPPKSEQPVFLFSMLDMESPFNGIIVDLKMLRQTMRNLNRNIFQFRNWFLSGKMIIQ